MNNTNDILKECCEFHDCVWPEHLFTGVMFYKGLRITKDEFERANKNISICPKCEYISYDDRTHELSIENELLKRKLAKAIDQRNDIIFQEAPLSMHSSYIDTFDLILEELI